MTLPLTSEMLAAAYTYLTSTPPFSCWNLPDAEDIEFKVSRRGGEFGRYQWNGRRHAISMSTKSIGQTATLLQYLAHEIIHLHLEIIGAESKSPNPDVHNEAFRKLAAKVCRIHGFDPKAFY